MSTASCNATSADVCWTRGDSGRLDVTVTQSDGTAYDLTGSTLFLTVKNALTDADSAAVIRKEVTAHDAPEAGESHFEILTTDNATAGTRFYDVQLVTSVGDVFTLFGGFWKVVGDVTARVEPLAFNAVVVSGAGSAQANGTYVLTGSLNGKGVWTLSNDAMIFYNASEGWLINVSSEVLYLSTDDTEFPWEAEYELNDGNNPIPTLTPIII
jgi:hypothetical protein